MNDLDLGYRYGRPSSFDAETSSLALATSGGTGVTGLLDQPRFFSGFFTFPAVAAEGLRAVGRVAGSSYADRSQDLSRFRDPVVTSDGECLRFESFSACGGVYARLDVLADGIDGVIGERGTTNVDINEPLRRMLAGVSPSSVLHVAVGSDDLVVSDTQSSVVERRVVLPERWLRGFAESQQIASTFDARLDLNAAEAARFLRTAVTARTSGWVVAAGRGARVTARAGSQAVYLADARRLEALVPLVRLGRRMRAYGPAVVDGQDVASSGWEIDLPGARFVVLLSPSAWRGFSGEGAALEFLIGDDVFDDAERARARLGYEAHIDVADLADALGLSVSRIRSALSCLAAAGQVGYDLACAEYFRRELPYDSSSVEGMNPRLRAARALVDAGAVVLVNDTTAEISSGDALYRVRAHGGEMRCTCAWWAAHRGGRGPCKHVLAVQMQRGRAPMGEPRHASESVAVAVDPHAHPAP